MSEDGEKKEKKMIIWLVLYCFGLARAIAAKNADEEDLRVRRGRRVKNDYWLDEWVRTRCSTRS